MSKRVIFTCTMLLLLGLLGLFDMFSSFSRGQLSFNLGTLFIPVSMALFMGIPGSRVAATVVFSIIYLSLALLLVGASVAHVGVLHANIPMPVNPFQFILLFVVIFACVLSLLHWMLYSPAFDEHLKPQVRATEIEK